MGRPSLYTPELIEAIAERLSKGEPMAAICRDEGMPAYRTVKDWMDTSPDVSALIARAREEGFDAIAAGTLEIADDGRNDYMEQSDDEGGIAFKLNGEHIQRSKLRIETRLKLLAKWDPKRYGDRMTLAGDADNPVMGMTEAQVDARLAVLQAKLLADKPDA
ncbi:terminase [Rhodanobacter caeni]|uniref:Terminase n=2 Tax=Rhodanobacter caeni TaxID=657654 RepID=A0ABN0UT15_9GAMM